MAISPENEYKVQLSEGITKKLVECSLRAGETPETYLQRLLEHEATAETDRTNAPVLPVVFQIGTPIRHTPGQFLDDYELPSDVDDYNPVPAKSVSTVTMTFRFAGRQRPPSYADEQ